MTEGMQGRSSDTRMYNPRSESSHMYRNNHEEDTYSPDDAKHRDEKYEENKKKERKERACKVNAHSYQTEGLTTL